MLTDDSAEDLVEYLTWTDEPATAAAALAELWARFMGYVFTALRNHCGSRFSTDQLIDFTNDTFIRAQERAASYRTANLTEVDQAFRKVGAWLCAVAKSVVADFYRDAAGDLDCGVLDDDCDRVDEPSGHSPEHLW